MATATKGTSRTTDKKKEAAAPVANDIFAWEDDPFSQATPTSPPVESAPIQVPVPQLGAGSLPTAIQAPAGGAPPAGEYHPNTSQFRYWAAAAALQRGAAFWAGLLPAGTRWHSTVGSRLQVRLDDGIDLNAYYDRSGLSFFHDTVAGRVFYSGESPDVVCHELGHAVLDALRPQLWDAGSIEVAAFHESFGDMSAILSALQIPSLRSRVLMETGGNLYVSSRLSRLAEQLGWAIRQRYPQAADPDCLRNAVNAFFYQDPLTLPTSAPASTLSSEAHSFSRVFTGAFFEALAGMLAAEAGGAVPTSAQLQNVSQSMGQLLATAIPETPIVPNYYSQVAAHMVAAATGALARYQDALHDAFVQHGVLSLEAAALMQGPATTLPARAAAAPGQPRPAAMAELPRTQLSVAEFGLSIDAIEVPVASETRRFQVASAAPGGMSATSPAHDDAARHFVINLLRRGRVDLQEHGRASRLTAYPFANRTHELRTEDGKVVLRRRLFHCGFCNHSE